ncbi:hypothetical protein [Streptomyces sp. NBC_00878]|uniref:hypothetical protein n=1 Tax=Streptomyces sp. NBC_00878 TaxID=2975854 RepID=UPI0022532518|nr:hypothetical protein [Streptomyces sp. NBC_00878]MCX4906160.1 hypothetical protein [Streptomyces sp. NBC_00878]
MKKAIPLKRVTAAATAGSALLTAGLLAAGPAQAATSDTASPARALSCVVELGKPARGGSGVTASVRTSGCGTNVKWNAKLQSSRWWGWADDAAQSWNGSQLRRLTATCAGVHDHRVIVQAVVDGQGSPWKVGPTATLNCG